MMNPIDYWWVTMNTEPKRASTPQKIVVAITLFVLFVILPSLAGGL